MSGMFRRDANLDIRPGTVVAEFSCGTMALSFIERCLDKSFTVTAGINLTFAVRKRQPESAAAIVHGADAAAAPNSLQGRGSFSLHALTPKGRERLPELERLLGRLPHTGDM